MRRELVTVRSNLVDKVQRNMLDPCIFNVAGFGFKFGIKSFRTVLVGYAIV